MVSKFEISVEITESSEGVPDAMNRNIVAPSSLLQLTSRIVNQKFWFSIWFRLSVQQIV